MCKEWKLSDRSLGTSGFGTELQNCCGAISKCKVQTVLHGCTSVHSSEERSYCSRTICCVHSLLGFGLTASRDMSYYFAWKTTSTQVATMPITYPPSVKCTKRPMIIFRSLPNHWHMQTKKKDSFELTPDEPTQYRYCREPLFPPQSTR
jgi:hypothetical protein